jgi:HEAT repeat protein
MRRSVVALVACGAWTCAAAALAAEPPAEDWLQGLRAPEESARLRAIDTLGNRGAKTPGAVAALAQQLGDPSAKVRVHAAEALGQIGAAAKEAGPAIGALLSDPNLHVRRAAIRAIGKIRLEPKVSIPLLMKTVDDSDPAVRLGALDALAELGKEAVPPLVEALGHEKTAYWACLALGELGADAAPAVAELQRLLRDDRRAEVRREAALVLGSIGSRSAPAVPLLAHALGEKDVGLQMAAVFALGRIGPKAKAAEQSLRKMLGTGTPPLLRTFAVWALARIRPEDKQLSQRAVAVLTESMRNKDPSVRATAVRGLVDMRAASETLVPAMSRIVEEGPAELRDDALSVLQSVGEPAVPALVNAMKFPEVRPRAAAILGRIGPQAKAAVPALVDLTKSDDPTARRQALLALAAMGPAAHAAAPAAIGALRDTDMNVRYSACYALGKMGAAAMDGRAALQRELDSRDPYISLAAAWALARIDPDCSQTPPKALPMLVKALDDSDPMVRLEAASSMRCLGPQARPAAAALRKVAKEDPSELVRDMAAEALKALEE